MSIFDPLKRVERLKKARPGRQADAELENRIPPGQYETKKFPVLTYGDTQHIQPGEWKLHIFGLVENPLVLNWQELLALPAVSIRRDIHCVTRWSMLDSHWEGVLFSELVKKVRPAPEARFVMQHSYGGYTTNLPLEDLLKEDVIIAYQYEGKPLDPDHGGPVRMVAPQLYFWKSAKWLKGLEFMAGDRPGFWEQYGYHMHGDPWSEERFG